MKQKSKVIFIPVSTNQNKISCICTTIQRHFEQGQSILIRVSNETAEKYVDNLLWKHPEESFLPHVATTVPTDDRVIITQDMKNLNNSSILFNLSTQPFLSDEFEVIYELYDETHHEKLLQSQSRRRIYKENGFILG